MHRAPRQTASKSGIDRAGAQGNEAVLPGLVARIETGESLAQRTEIMCSVHDYVPILFY